MFFIVVLAILDSIEELGHAPCSRQMAQILLNKITIDQIGVRVG